MKRLKRNIGIFCLAFMMCIFVACDNSENSGGAGAGQSVSQTTTAIEITLPSSKGDSQTDSESTDEDAKQNVTEERVERVSFMAVGDNLIHPALYEFAEVMDGSPGDGNYDFKVFFERLKPFINQADIAFINQETISGGDEKGLSGYPSFNTPKDMIFNLEELGFDLVSMANNHALDTGISGIYHALYNWAKTDCVTSGVNADEEMRMTIPVIERNGVKFAFLAYTAHTNGVTPDTNWRINYMEKEAIERDVAKAKELADFVIVSAHWGWDDVFSIDDFQRDYAQIFADSGVDVVVGTGPHVLQHIEWIERSGNATEISPTEVYTYKEDGSLADGVSAENLVNSGSVEDKMLCVFSLGNYCSGMLGRFNELTGVLTMEFVIEEFEGSVQRSVEDVMLTPIVMHKESGYTVMGVYLLDDYNDELAARSIVNTFSGGLNMDYFDRILHEQIAPEFLPSSYR